MKKNSAKPTLEDVRRYWESSPLFSYELGSVPTHEYFERIDQIKKEDVEKFSYELWEFEKFQGKKVLDIGCGPGWYTVQYCLGGAEVFAIDLSSSAVQICKEHLKYRNLVADVKVGNAEDLSFDDGTFDLVVSPGVLHHTPNLIKAFQEVYRVLKPGGKAKISLYHKGILHSKLVFPLTKLAIRLMKIKHPGADFSRTITDVDDFIRQYDGIGNPIGIGKTTREWLELVKEVGFEVLRYQLYYFPKRFLPYHIKSPRLLRFLDKNFGTMIFLDLRKSQ